MFFESGDEQDDKLAKKHVPFLQLKQISVKLREENVAVELGHDVGQVHQVAPRVIQRSLSAN